MADLSLFGNSTVPSAMQAGFNAAGGTQTLGNTKLSNGIEVKH